MLHQQHFNQEISKRKKNSPSEIEGCKIAQMQQMSITNQGAFFIWNRFALKEVVVAMDVRFYSFGSCTIWCYLLLFNHHAFASRPRYGEEVIIMNHTTPLFCEAQINHVLFLIAINRKVSIMKWYLGALVTKSTGCWAPSDWVLNQGIIF